MNSVSYRGYIPEYTPLLHNTKLLDLYILYLVRYRMHVGRLTSIPALSKVSTAFQ